MNRVLITGTSRGIGRALKEAFVARGDMVVGYCRSEMGDIREKATVFKLRELAASKRVNILVNNAGVYSEDDVATMDSEEARRIIEVNLIAPMLLTAALWPVLTNESGTVVFVNSVAGRVFAGKEVAYRASKHGLTGLAGALYYEGLRDGIRVVDIPLGGVNTDMLKHRPRMADNPRQQPEAAATLILEVLDSGNVANIRHFLLNGKIIDNRSRSI